MKPFFRVLLVLCLFQTAKHASATHIVGGEMNYRYLGNNVYRISLTVYRDCYNGVPPFDNPASVGIFNAITNTLIREKFFNLQNIDTVPPTINSPCFIPPTDVCYERTVYTDTVVLPASPGGYILAYQRCCRNQTILNIVVPDATGATYEAWIAGTGTYSQNSNPVFTLWPPPFICAGLPFVFDHSATDFEGDSILYELVTPHEGGTVPNPMPQPPANPPYSPIVWNTPYGQSDMLGGTPPMSIDPATGLLTCYPTTIGQFVIGVRAKEFRNGVLVGYTRRDFQLNVVPCPSLVVAALQNPQVICGSNTVSFQNLSFNAGSYQWDFGVTGSTADTSNQIAPSFTYPDTGTYTVTLIAVSSLDPTCADTTMGTVTVLPDFQSTFNFIIDPCTNTVAFNDTLLQSGGGIATIRQWTFGDGNTSVIEDPVHTYAQSGTYIVRLISESDRGCIDTNIRLVTIAPLLDVQVQQANPVSCTGDCNGTAVVSGINGQAPFAYQWNDPQNQTTASVNALCPGTYLVTVTDSRNCSATDSVNISEPSPLLLSVNATPDYCGGICAGTATAVPSGGSTGYSYQWTDPQGQTSATATGLCPGWYTVQLTDQNGCSRLDSVLVVYTDSFPSVTATADTTLLFPGQSTVLHAVATGTGNSYSWSPSTGLNNPNVADPVANPGAPTDYIVVLTDANGCTATDTIRLIIRTVVCDEPDIFIPNAFSPNNDQRNDIFLVRSGFLTEIHLRIYDRWGELVFESRDLNKGWDGRFKGETVPPDVYVYTIEGTCYDRGEFSKQGNVTVIR